MKNIIFTTLLVSAALADTSAARHCLFPASKDRGLSTVRFLDDALSSNSSKLSIDKIRNQIIDILQADRQAQQIAWARAVRPFHARAVFDQALDTTKRGRSLP